MKVSVIGGGLIGMSVAWRLAKSGAEVTVHDRGKIGRECSWAGAGMLAPAAESFPSAVWKDAAQAAFDVYPTFIESLEAASGSAIDFRIWHGEGQVDPRDLMAALEVACRNDGVRIFEDSPVTELDPAIHTVVAAGAWAGGIRVPDHTLPETYPVKGYLLGYRMPPGSLPKTLHGTLNEGGTYILQRNSGYTIAGSTEEETEDRLVDTAVVDELRQRAEALWPELVGRAPDDVWFGFRPASRSGHPHVERLAGTNIWLAYGHFRNGILLAPWTAERIASEVTASLETPSPAIS